MWKEALSLQRKATNFGDFFGLSERFKRLLFFQVWNKSRIGSLDASMEGSVDGTGLTP